LTFMTYFRRSGAQTAVLGRVPWTSRRTCFGRDAEWQALDEFARASGPGLRLGVVHGRRRQGKSFLLRHG
jgi:hypothetical protein